MDCPLLLISELDGILVNLLAQLCHQAPKLILFNFSKLPFYMCKTYGI
jgi:hypothetical protein